MKKVISFLEVMMLIVMLNSCVTAQPITPSTYEGATVTTIARVLLEPFLTDHNPWHGGMIGGVLGAVGRATITEMSVRATREV